MQQIGRPDVAPDYPAADLIRVLLVGDRWELLQPTFASLSRRRSTLFVGPVWNDLANALSKTSPSLLLLSEPRMLAYLDGDKLLPSQPILLCLNREALRAEDIYPRANDLLLVSCCEVELEIRISRLVSGYEPKEKVLQVGQIILDQNTYQAVVDRRRIDLAWMEFQLLEFLMRNKGRVFRREELLANVWGFDNFGGTRTVDVHIRRLRSKLGIKAADHFRTVKNVGYGLFAEE